MSKLANRTGVQKARERFLAGELATLERRRSGSLARAPGGPLPGESAAELQWLAVEDRHLAEEGLVELRAVMGRGSSTWTA